MPKTITMRLSTASINKAVRELREYAKDLERKNALFLQRMVDEGVRIAKAEAPFDWGDLYGSIHGKVKGNVGYVICDVKSSKGFPYAVAIEFGYGKNKEPWVYYDVKNDKFLTSSGQPPNPFFQRTANQLKQIAPMIARDVFKG